MRVRRIYTRSLSVFIPRWHKIYTTQHKIHTTQAQDLYHTSTRFIPHKHKIYTTQHKIHTTQHKMTQTSLKSATEIRKRPSRKPLYCHLHINVFASHIIFAHSQCDSCPHAHPHHLHIYTLSVGKFLHITYLEVNVVHDQQCRVHKNQECHHQNLWPTECA